MEQRVGQIDRGSRADTLLLVGIAAIISLVHLLTNGRYGFHRDELQVLSDARHLDWGFVPYPPLTPFVERIGLSIFGLSMVGLRLFSVISQAFAIFFTGLMARELDGGRLAQVTAALAIALSPLPMFEGTEFQYTTFDYLWWVLIAYFVIRLLKTENARWWLAIGATIGVGFLTKYTMGFYLCGILGGLVLTRARRYLGNAWFWGGMALGAVICLPNLVWQVRHGFISLHFLQHIHARDVDETGSHIRRQVVEHGAVDETGRRGIEILAGAVGIALALEQSCRVGWRRPAGHALVAHPRQPRATKGGVIDSIGSRQSARMRQGGPHTFAVTPRLDDDNGFYARGGAFVRGLCLAVDCETRRVHGCSLRREHSTAWHARKNRERFMSHYLRIVPGAPIQVWSIKDGIAVRVGRSARGSGADIAANGPQDHCWQALQYYSRLGPGDVDRQVGRPILRLEAVTVDGGSAQTAGSGLLCAVDSAGHAVSVRSSARPTRQA